MSLEPTPLDYASPPPKTRRSLWNIVVTTVSITLATIMGLLSFVWGVLAVLNHEWSDGILALLFGLMIAALFLLRNELLRRRERQAR